MLNLLKENDILFVSAVISYIIYMMIIPKFVTITIVVVLFFFLIFHFIRQLLKDGIVKIPEYSRYYGAFLLYIAVSIFWTVNPDYSFPLIRAFLCFEFALIIGCFSKTTNDIRKILKGLIFGAIISSAVVLYNQYQYIGIMRLGDKIYGSAMEFSGGITVAAYCCLFLWKSEDKIKYLFLFFLFLIICALSGSRSAIAYPFIFFFIMSFFYHQQFTKILKIMLIIGTLGIASLNAFLNIPVFYDVVGYRIETLLEDKTEDGSYMERKEMKEYAIKLWTEKPIMGWGVNGFSKKYAVINKPVYSHCDYTEILCCFGLIGAFLFYSPIIMMFFRKNIFKIMKSNWTQSFLGCIVIFTIIEITHSIVFLSVRSIMLLAISFQFFTKQKRSIS